MNKILDNQTKELEEVDVLDEQIEELNLIIFNGLLQTHCTVYRKHLYSAACQEEGVFSAR